MYDPREMRSRILLTLSHTRAQDKIPNQNITVVNCLACDMSKRWLSVSVMGTKARVVDLPCIKCRIGAAVETAAFR